MHYRMFAVTGEKSIRNSRMAREYVYNVLSNDHSFCGEGGRFHSPMADWFVIGGRWSGYLTKELELNKDDLKEFYNECEEKKLFWTSRENTEEMQRAKVHEVFRKYFPDFTGEIPVYRDAYKELGSEDDAMIITPEIYDKCLKTYEGQEWDDEFCYLDHEFLTEEVIGNCWVVLIDYHN